MLDHKPTPRDLTLGSTVFNNNVYPEAFSRFCCVSPAAVFPVTTGDLSCCPTEILELIANFIYGNPRVLKKVTGSSYWRSVQKIKLGEHNLAHMVWKYGFHPNPSALQVSIGGQSATPSVAASVFPNDDLFETPMTVFEFGHKKKDIAVTCMKELLVNGGHARCNDRYRRRAGSKEPVGSMCWAECQHDPHISTLQLDNVLGFDAFDDEPSAMWKLLSQETPTLPKNSQISAVVPKSLPSASWRKFMQSVLSGNATEDEASLINAVKGFSNADYVTRDTTTLYTPLAAAVALGCSIAVIEALVSKSIVIHPTRPAESPFHIACAERDGKVIRAVLGSNSPEIIGRTFCGVESPLNLVLDRKDATAVLPTILEVVKDAAISFDLSMIHKLCRKRNLSIFDNPPLWCPLLRTGALQWGCTELGTFIHNAAARLEQLNVLKALLEVSNPKILLELLTWQGETALHTAVNANNFKAVEMLLEREPRLAFAANHRNQIPLTVALDRKRDNKTMRAKLEEATLKNLQCLNVPVLDLLASVAILREHVKLAEVVLERLKTIETPVSDNLLRVVALRGSPQFIKEHLLHYIGAPAACRFISRDGNMLCIAIRAGRIDSAKALLPIVPQIKTIEAAEEGQKMYSPFVEAVVGDAKDLIEPITKLANGVDRKLFRAAVDTITARGASYTLLKRAKHIVPHIGVPDAWKIIVESIMLHETKFANQRDLVSHADQILTGLGSEKALRVLSMVDNQFLWSRLPASAKMQPWATAVFTAAISKHTGKPIAPDIAQAVFARCHYFAPSKGGLHGHSAYVSLLWHLHEHKITDISLQNRAEVDWAVSSSAPGHLVWPFVRNTPKDVFKECHRRDVLKRPPTDADLEKNMSFILAVLKLMVEDLQGEVYLGIVTAMQKGDLKVAFNWLGILDRCEATHPAIHVADSSYFVAKGELRTKGGHRNKPSLHTAVAMGCLERGNFEHLRPDDVEVGKETTRGNLLASIAAAFMACNLDDKIILKFAGYVARFGEAAIRPAVAYGRFDLAAELLDKYKGVVPPIHDRAIRRIKKYNKHASIPPIIDSYKIKPLMMAYVSPDVSHEMFEEFVSIIGDASAKDITDSDWHMFHAFPAGRVNLSSEKDRQVKATAYQPFSFAPRRINYIIDHNFYAESQSHHSMALSQIYATAAGRANADEKLKRIVKAGPTDLVKWYMFETAICFGLWKTVKAILKTLPNYTAGAQAVKRDGHHQVRGMVVRNNTKLRQERGTLPAPDLEYIATRLAYNGSSELLELALTKARWDNLCVLPHNANIVKTLYVREFPKKSPRKEILSLIAGRMANEKDTTAHSKVVRFLALHASPTAVEDLQHFLTTAKYKPDLKALKAMLAGGRFDLFCTHMTEECKGSLVELLHHTLLTARSETAIKFVQKFDATNTLWPERLAAHGQDLLSAAARNPSVAFFEFAVSHPKITPLTREVYTAALAAVVNHTPSSQLEPYLKALVAARNKAPDLHEVDFCDALDVNHDAASPAMRPFVDLVKPPKSVVDFSQQLKLLKLLVEATGAKELKDCPISPKRLAACVKEVTADKLNDALFLNKKTLTVLTCAAKRNDGLMKMLGTWCASQSTGRLDPVRFVILSQSHPSKYALVMEASPTLQIDEIARYAAGQRDVEFFRWLDNSSRRSDTDVKSIEPFVPMHFAGERWSDAERRLAETMNGNAEVSEGEIRNHVQLSLFRCVPNESKIISELTGFTKITLANTDSLTLGSLVRFAISHRLTTLFSGFLQWGSSAEQASWKKLVQKMKRDSEGPKRCPQFIPCENITELQIEVMKHFKNHICGEIVLQVETEGTSYAEFTKNRKLIFHYNPDEPESTHENARIEVGLGLRVNDDQKDDDIRGTRALATYSAWFALLDDQYRYRRSTCLEMERGAVPLRPCQLDLPVQQLHHLLGTDIDSRCENLLASQFVARAMLKYTALVRQPDKDDFLSNPWMSTIYQKITCKTFDTPEERIQFLETFVSEIPSKTPHPRGPELGFIHELPVGIPSHDMALELEEIFSLTEGYFSGVEDPLVGTLVPKGYRAMPQPVFKANAGKK